MFTGFTEDFNCDSKSMNINLNPDEPQNLLTFIVGFSGRSFDYIQNDQKTAVSVVYNRGVPNSYGGVYLNFYEKTLTAKFFYSDDKNFVLTTQNVNSGKDNYDALEKYTEFKINGTLGNNTRVFHFFYV
jgi:hypothetical protein